jgi:hypothetical protein
MEDVPTVETSSHFAEAPSPAYVGQGCHARWYIFVPKIPIWVKLGGPWNGKCWLYFMTVWNTTYVYGNLIYIFYGDLVYVVVIWYSFPVLIEVFFPFWYFVPR